MNRKNCRLFKNNHIMRTVWSQIFSIQDKREKEQRPLENFTNNYLFTLNGKN